MLKITLTENGVDWTCIDGDRYIQSGHIPAKEPQKLLEIQAEKLATYIQKAVHRDFGDIIKITDEIKIINNLSL